MDSTVASKFKGSKPAKKNEAEAFVKFRAPGPGEYKIPDAIGKQVVSTQKTAEYATFGTGARDAGSRATDEPGPGAYFKLRPIGKSGLSTERNTPSYSLRSREKFGNTVGGTAAETPGPGAYPKIENPRARRAPAFSMRARPEDVSNRGAKATPAPGRYKAPDAFGKQPSSNRPSAPGVKFGLSKRKAIIKSQSDVGPGDYTCSESIGTQKLSTKRSSACFTFGSRPKDKKLGAARNGPGSYKPLESIGRQSSSKLRSAPSISFSGRTRFGDPYHY